MEILFFTPWHPNEANPTLGNFILRQVELLRQRHSVRLLAYSTDARYTHCEAEIENENHLHLQFDPSKLEQRLRRRRRVEEWLAQSKPPELLIGCIPHQSGALMKRLKNKYKVPLLMIEHWSGWLDERKSRLSPGQKYRTFLAAQSVDLLLPVTRQLGEKLAQKLGCDYLLWRNPVDPGLFYPQNEKRFDFIHLSTLDANKKPDSILRAFCEVLKIKPGLKLSIGGDGPIQGLQSLIEELGIAHSVELHGRLSYEEAAERIRSSRCLVQFSGYENLPCVVTEALAAGLRVISSKVGGIAEVVREGENGHLVEAQNEKALIKAMLNMLNAPSAPPAAYTESKPEHLLEEFEKVLEKLFTSRA